MVAIAHTKRKKTSLLEEERRQDHVRREGGGKYGWSVKNGGREEEGEGRVFDTRTTKKESTCRNTTHRMPST
jgi:hypothetical protein